MKFVVEIELGNEAMLRPADVAEALFRMKDEVLGGVGCGSVRDGNGNTVGSFKLLTFDGEEMSFFLPPDEEMATALRDAYDRVDAYPDDEDAEEAMYEAEGQVIVRLGIPIDETAQGLTEDAADRIRGFLQEL